MRSALDLTTGIAAIALAPLLALLWAAAIYVRIGRAVASELRRTQPGASA